MDHLKNICEKEKISIDEDTLTEIATSTSGSLRDAFSLLDKLRSYSNDNITINEYYEMNGLITNDEIEYVLKAIYSIDYKSFIDSIHNFNDNGKNIVEVINQLNNYVRNLVLRYYSKFESVNYKINDLVGLNNLINKNLIDIKKSDNPYFYFESLILKYINSLDEDVSRETSNKDENNKKEEQIKVVHNIKDIVVDDKKDEDKKTITINKEDEIKKDVSRETLDKKVIINIKDIMSARLNNTLLKSKVTLKKKEIQLLEKLKEGSLDMNIGYLINNILDGKIQCVDDECVVFSYDYDSILDSNLENIDKLTKLYNEFTESSKNLCFVSDELWNEVSSSFMEAFKNKNIEEKFQYIKEPEPIFEEYKNNDIIVDDAIKLFDNDIVKIKE